MIIDTILNIKFEVRLDGDLSVLSYRQNKNVFSEISELRLFTWSERSELLSSLQRLRTLCYSVVNFEFWEQHSLTLELNTTRSSQIE